MRALVQRARWARVRVIGDPPPGAETASNELVAEIGPGLLVLVGVGREDDARRAAELARKVVGLRIFEDAAGRMNLGLAEVGGAMLAVSQFTLYADTRRGRRPGFEAAAPPDQAEPLVERFVAEARALGAAVQTGRFRTHMRVELCNDGPVTLLVEV